MGCYRRRDECIRQVFPEYGPGYKSKIVLPNALAGSAYNVFTLVIETPGGSQQRARLPLAAYLGIVAATNMKQRTRKQIEYYHADRLNYAVAGTPNRLEYDQGFFVKNGDGAADLKPIAHLYKSQVYQLAEYLGVPEEVRRRTPTTDTYSLAQTQEEFYFALPYAQMDLCLYALDHGVPAVEAAAAVGLTPPQVESVYKDIQGKRRATRYGHEPPLLVEPVLGGGAAG
jgi:NAD+ synthase